MELIPPTESYKESYIQALREYHAEERYLDEDIEILSKDFSAFVTGILSQSEGKNLPERYVPQTTLWLVDGGDYIGTARIRHTLSDMLKKVGGHIGYEIRPSRRKSGYGSEILRLALIEARALGIGRALLTCDSTNIGSRKIIEKNRGIFEDETPSNDGSPSKLRFWIDVQKTVG